MIGMQMVDLPADRDGLNWIVNQDATRLLLIPGLQPASIAAAAAGDQQALAYLRFTAQQNAADPGACAVGPLDRACLQASKVDHSKSYSRFCRKLSEEHPQIVLVFEAREMYTKQQHIKAASTGKLAALKWMQAICPQTFMIKCNLMTPAAAAGHLSILKHLRSGPNPADWYGNVTAAAVPHLDCFKWLVSTDAPGGPCPYNDLILPEIAEHHGLSALQWCRNNCKLSQRVWNWLLTDKAASMGNQAMLEWLRAQEPPVPWNDLVCATAASRGDIDMLCWLRGQDPPCPWDVNVTAAAASSDVKTLQWLRAQHPPCSWDSRSCRAAARAGKLEILIWLRAQKPPCPWTSTTFEAATEQPDVEILEWLHENGCPLQLPTPMPCIIAARCGHLAVLQWLCEHGHLLTGNLYVHAAVSNSNHILRFLHKMEISRPEPNVEDGQYGFFRLPMAMFLADIGVRLSRKTSKEVTRARRAHCAFHGLVRWCRHALSDPSREAHLAFDSLAEDRSGQLLLTRLSLLPPELVHKVAAAAELQHDIFLTS